MTEKELIDLLVDQGIHIAYLTDDNGDESYIVSLFGENIEIFYIYEDAENFRATLQAVVKQNIEQILFNKKLSNKLKEEYENSEISIAIKRQKFLMGKNNE